MKRYATEISRETWVFRDRQEAGQLLAERLSRYREEKPIVLALPRGGVVVGYEIAHAMGAPLDVVVARKLGTPGQPEVALGAIAPGGVYVLNEDIIGWLDISEDEIEQIASQEAREMDRRMRRFRGDKPKLALEGKTAILVDDGIATGMTVRAAIEYLSQQEPGYLVLAVPLCAGETTEPLRSEVDDLVCIKAPPELLAIGYWYEDFEQVSVEEAVDLLKLSRREHENQVRKGRRRIDGTAPGEGHYRTGRARREPGPRNRGWRIVALEKDAGSGPVGHPLIGRQIEALYLAVHYGWVPFIATPRCG